MQIRRCARDDKKAKLTSPLIFPFPSAPDFAHNEASKLVKKPKSSSPAFRSLKSRIGGIGSQRATEEGAKMQIPRLGPRDDKKRL
jgi:hypothetical protein